MTMTAPTIDHPLTTEPALTLCPNPTTPNPFAELVALADEQRARILAVIPAIVEIIRAEQVLDRRYTALADQLTVMTRGAAAVGFATLPEDPQGEIFGALLDVFDGGVGTYLGLISCVTRGSWESLDTLSDICQEAAA
jgi:hypothetical protein